MVTIDEKLKNDISVCFPERITKAEYDRSKNSRGYLFVTTSLAADDELHYEYVAGRVELHLEGKYQQKECREFARQLRIETSRNDELEWDMWQNVSQCRCTLKDCNPESPEEMMDAFQHIMDIIDPIIESISKQQTTEAYAGERDFKDERLKGDDVILKACPLGQLFSNRLVIPEYQRNYCWEEQQVANLWSSMGDIPPKGKYHLGTIILQKDKDGNYAVIDGQQRLVTLTLICRKLGYKGELPLLKQTFRSEASRRHVANNRYQIEQYCDRNHDGTLCRKIINNLIFSTLILTDSRLDLAYTFFSNENSKGIPLSDYDLLKAHHLRFVYNEGQAEHLASKWNLLVSQKYGLVDDTLSKHLYRLRKWMRKEGYDVSKKHRTKDEFSAALTIPDIPAFGEQFDFYEKIQGGPHFFAYTEHFVEKYERFQETRQVGALRRHVRWESHWKYEEMIETLLFGYYLKFGSQYLTEALFCIASNIAQHRYTSARALSYKIRESAKDSEIIMMIDQASSPTFFFAECLSRIRNWGNEIEEQNIRQRFFQRLQDLFNELTDSFTDRYIIEKCNNEYK